MSNLQIRGVPAALHEALAERARARGLTMSQYVIQLLERDLGRPTMEDWLEGLAADWAASSVASSAHVDTVHVIDDVRAELESHTAHAAGEAETRASVRSGPRR